MPHFGPRSVVMAREFVRFLDAHTTEALAGKPQRYRTFINGIPLSASDRRMIRRWRNRHVMYVTTKTASALLSRYQLHPTEEAHT